jgi:hypothetical protein
VFIMNTLRLSEHILPFLAFFALFSTYLLILRLQQLIAYDALQRWVARCGFTLLSARRALGVHPAQVDFEITYIGADGIARRSRVCCTQLYAGRLKQSVTLADDGSRIGSPIPGSLVFGRDI